MRHIYQFFRLWAGATRATFASASMVPVVLGAAIASHHGSFSPGLFFTSATGVLALHLGANLVNDYYDFKSGADVIRTNRTPFYGGSTILVGGILSPRQVSRAYTFLFALACAIGAYLAVVRGPGVIAFGLAGLLGGYFYTAPPLHLSYIGLGETTISMCFGPLTVAGAYFVQTGAVTPESLVASIPVALLVAAIVYVNEFPDRGADGAAGKKTLVVRLPLRTAIRCYYALVLMPFVFLGAAIALGILPRSTALAYLALPLAPYAIKHLCAAYAACQDPSTLDPSSFATPHQVAASVATISLHLAVGLLLSLGYLL